MIDWTRVVTPPMDEAEVLHVMFGCGRAVGVSHGVSELERCSPERAQRVLELFESDVAALWDEVPLLAGARAPEDLPSLNGRDEKGVGMMFLAGARLQAYDGITDVDSLVRAYMDGYNVGIEEGVVQKARAVLGVEP